MPLTNAEIDEQIRQGEAARRAREEANRTLASMGAPSYTPADPMMSTAPAPPPAFPPPPGAPLPPSISAPPPHEAKGEMSKAEKIARESAKRIAINALTGPAGGFVPIGRPLEGFAAEAAVSDKKNEPKPEPKKEEPKTEAPTEAPAPAAEAPTPPAYPQPSGGVVLPGGMYPDTQDTKIHRGIPVPAEARVASGLGTSLELQAAEKERNAAQGYYGHVRKLHEAQLAGIADAEAKHARVQAERDAIVRQKLSDIEQLNKEAQGKPEDLWSDRTALASMLGAIAMGIGAIGIAAGKPGMAIPGVVSGRFIDSIIDRDINSKLKAREAAGQRAGREINLLELHRQKWGDDDKAIEATRLAYYDNILTQMEMYKAEHKAQVSDAAYNHLQGEILQKRAETVDKWAKQEHDDITEEEKLKYRDPRVIGGGGGGAKIEPGYIVRLADGTAYSMPNDKMQNEAFERIESLERLVRINNEISSLRKETANLPATEFGQYKVNIARLQELEQVKLKAIETASKQGVLREGEYPRAQAMTGHATTGLGYSRHINPFEQASQKAGQAVIEAQTARWTEDMHQLPAAFNGKIVRQGYTQTPAGELAPVAKYTGQDVKPVPGLPPRGFKPMDPRQKIRTMNAPDSETTPQAERFPYVPAPPAPGGHRKKK